MNNNAVHLLVPNLNKKAGALALHLLKTKSSWYTILDISNTNLNIKFKFWTLTTSPELKRYH